MEESKGDAPTTSQEPPAGDANRRPSLTERLMNPQRASDPGENADRPTAEPSTQEPAPGAGARDSRPADAERNRQAGMRQTTSQRTVFSRLRSHSDSSMSEALKDARRFIRVRYYSFLVMMLILLLTLVISAIVLAISLLSDSGWEQQAASGAVAGGALLLLILLQYNPAGGFSSAAAELSQLEALSTHLERSYALWDSFLDDRESKQQIVANEVALAVSSMTTATRELVAAQAEFVTARRAPRGSGPPPRPAFPSPTTPDPRRY